MISEDGFISGREAMYPFACELARSNKEAKPSISEIWLFPDEVEMRLIQLDDSVPLGNAMIPSLRDRNPDERSPFPTATVSINPSDKHLALPPGWINWEQARRII